MSFDLGFISIFIEDIVEYKGALWTEGISSWLYIEVIIKAISYRFFMVTFVLV